MKRSFNSDNPFGLAANYKPQPQTYPAAPGASPNTYGLPLPVGQPPAFNQPPPPPPGVNGQGSMAMSAPSTPAMANASDPWRNYGYGNQMQRPASAHAGYQPSAPGVYSPSTSSGPSQTPSYSPQPNQSPSSMPPPPPPPAQYGGRAPSYSMAMPPPPPPPSMGMPPRSASGPYYPAPPQPYGGQPMPGYGGSFPPPPPPGYQQGHEMHRAKKARLDGPPMPMSGPPPAALPHVLPRGGQNGYNLNNRGPPPMNFNNNNLSRSQNSQSPRLSGPPGPSLASTLPSPGIPLPPKPVVDANRPNRGTYERKGNAAPAPGRSGPPLMRTGEQVPRFRDGRRDGAGRGPHNNQRGGQGRRDNRGDRRAATNTTGAKRNRTWGKGDERHSPHPERKGDKVKEQRKTLTDFRIVGLEIKELDWSWKAEPSHEHEQHGSVEGVESVDGADSARGENKTASEAGDMSVDSIRPQLEAEKEHDTKEAPILHGPAPIDGVLPTIPIESAPSGEELPAPTSESPTIKAETNNKHARDEDEESRLEAEGQGKKIRSDAPTSLEPATLPSASPASVFVDHVSVKTHDSALHLPPANRENSRLRIYFCAPISDNGEAMNYLQKAVSKTSISSSEAIGASASLPQPAESGLPEPVVKTESVEPSSEITPRIEDIIAGPDANKLDEYPEDDNEDADVLGSLTAKKEATEAEESKAEQDIPNTDQAPQDQSSPDRISISYARNSRRLILDSFIVSEIKIFRKEGRIELLVDISPASTAHAVDDLRICKGLLVEAFDPHTDDYYIVDRAAIEEGWDTSDDQEDKSESTPLLPPLHRLASLRASEAGTSAPASQMVTIIAHLDVDNPLSEAKWVRSGETDAWSIVPVADPKGGLTTVESGWFGKIHVADPDLPTTFNDIAHHWVEQRGDSSPDVLNQFVSAQFQDVNNIIEIFLHVIRSNEGATTRTPPAAKTAEHRQDNISRAVLLGAPMPLQQTSLSLTTFLVFKLALEMATKADVDQEEMLFRLSDIVRQLPAQTFYKALDAQYAAWLQSKENGRGEGPGKESQ